MLSHMQLHGDGIPAYSLLAFEGKAAENGLCQLEASADDLIVRSCSVGVQTSRILGSVRLCMLQVTCDTTDRYLHNCQAKTTHSVAACCKHDSHAKIAAPTQQLNKAWLCWTAELARQLVGQPEGRGPHRGSNHGRAAEQWYR